MQKFINFIQEKKSTNKDLSFSFCGLSQSTSNHSYGPAIRSDYLIHIILSGKGTFMVNNSRVALKQGTGFIIAPGVSTFYQADNKEPWSYLWIGFSGELADFYLKNAGLLNGNFVFNIDNTEIFYQLILACLEHQSGSIIDELHLDANTQLFLAALIQEKLPVSSQTFEKVDNHIQRILEYLNENYRQPITIQAIGEQFNLDRSYLSRIFKKTMSVSIKEYLTRLRVSYAAELLSLTSYPIEIIAEKSGFSSADVFSRNFKQNYGSNPSAFRSAQRKLSNPPDQNVSFEDLLNELPLHE